MGTPETFLATQLRTMGDEALRILHQNGPCETDLALTGLGEDAFRKLVEAELLRRLNSSERVYKSPKGEAVRAEFPLAEWQALLSKIETVRSLISVMKSRLFMLDSAMGPLEGNVAQIVTTVEKFRA